MPVERIAIITREQWLALRQNDVTASAVGALFGVHPYSTLLALWNEKRGLELDPPDQAILERGQLLEPIAAHQAGKKRPTWIITKAAEYLRDPATRIGATPDYYIDDNGRRGVLQVKTVDPFEFERSWTEETPPFWITLQNATEVMLDNAEFGAVAAMVLNSRLDTYVYDIPRHAASEKRIVEAVKAFWANVETNTEPKPDYSRDGPLIAMMWPREKPGKVIDLRGDNALPGLLEDRERWKGIAKEASGHLETINAEIADKLRDAEAALVRDWRLTYKEQHRKEYMVRATSFRVLRASKEVSP